jgi:hypothetical protein
MGVLTQSCYISICPLSAFIFSAILAIVGPHHEPWFDAQAWLIARDATLWDLLAHRVRYEGSPGLWHLLLWFLSRAGMPFTWLGW